MRRFLRRMRRGGAFRDHSEESERKGKDEKEKEAKEKELERPAGNNAMWTDGAGHLSVLFTCCEPKAVFHYLTLKGFGLISGSLRHLLSVQPRFCGCLSFLPGLG